MYCEWKNQFNPFNSLKSIVWREYYEAIVKGIIPHPVSVTIDSTNRCNLSCSFCQYSDYRMDETVSEEDLIWLANVLSKLDVKSCCCSGGGEFFMHPFSGEFIHMLRDNGMQVGSITNGVLIDNFLDDILYSLRWIGISIDAGFSGTYEKLKGGSVKDFYRVIENIKTLVKKRKNNRSPSIGFKFLIHPGNYGELFEAVRLASDLGVDDFHARPAFGSIKWDSEMIDVALQQVTEAQQVFDSKDFHVYGVTHKFDEKFQKKFIDKCEVTPIAGLTFAADGYTYLCCDLRGEKMGRLCKWRDIEKVWGSKKHKNILKQLNPVYCPRRCTFMPHQEILERVFRLDEMCYHFP